MEEPLLQPLKGGDRLDAASWDVGMAMDKQNVVHSHNGTLLENEKKLSTYTTTCINLKNRLAEIMLSKKSQTTKNTLSVNPFIYSSRTHKTMDNDRKKIGSSLPPLGGRRLQRDIREYLGVMNCIDCGGWGLHRYKQLSAHWIVHLRSMHFVTCK